MISFPTLFSRVRMHSRFVLIGLSLAFLVSATGCTKVKMAMPNRASKSSQQSLTNGQDATPVPSRGGMAAGAGGGMSSAPGVKLRASIGEVGGGAKQSAPGVRLYSGLTPNL